MLRPCSFATLAFLVVSLTGSAARAQDIPGETGGTDPAAAPQQGSPPPSSTGSTAPATQPAPAPAPQQGTASGTQDPALVDDEQALYEEEVGTEEHYSRAHPHEEAGESYNFLGAFYRHHFLPEAMFKLFLDAAPSENFPQIGGEFIHRKDGFDVIASVYYADFSGHGPFLGKGDPPTDVEWIDSSLWAVMGGVTFLWGSHFSDWFAIQYGLGIGVGALLGDIVRTEAYPTNDGHARCVAPSNPGQPGSAQTDQPFVAPSAGETVQQYCAAPTNFPTDADGATGEHYGVTARTWLDGGSVPNLWFRFAPQLSLRFKPMHYLLLRIDGGFDLFSGAFVGAAAAIGF